MKFECRKNVEPTVLQRILPPQLRDLLPSALPGTAFTVLVFSKKERVVRSRVAAKAVRLVDETPALAFGLCFTREAAQVLEDSGIEVFAKDREFWSESSYEDIKVSIGAGVKRPPSSSRSSKGLDDSQPGSPNSEEARLPTPGGGGS